MKIRISLIIANTFDSSCVDHFYRFQNLKAQNSFNAFFWFSRTMFMGFATGRYQLN